MSIQGLLELAAERAKRVVLEGLHLAKETTGDVNPFGDHTLLLDERAEDEVISVLSNSEIPFVVLTEEKGQLLLGEDPEYIVIIDPIDGSANLERNIPLCSIGISALAYCEEPTTDDVEVSIIDSFFAEERYIALTGKGVTKNGKSISVKEPVDIDRAIISYDTKRDWDTSFSSSSQRVLRAVKDMRRTASNLIDLCWTACGSLDAMVDLRGLLPIVHVCGTHMVFEAGGYVLDSHGKKFCEPLTLDSRMSFIAASCKDLAEDIWNRFRGD